MKIFHLSTPMSWRGGEQQLAYLIEGLEEQGVEIVLACPKHSALAAYAQERGWQVKLFPKRSAFDPRLLWWLRKALQEEKPDLLHVHDSTAHTLGVLVNRFHASSPPIILHRRNPIPVKSQLFAQYKYNHPTISRIICVSQAVQLAMLPGLQKKDHLRVVYDGIDLTRFGQPATFDLRMHLGLPAETPLVGNVAALSPQKDLFTWLLIAKKVCAQSSSHWVLVGEGSERKALATACEALGIAGRVHLLGFREDVPALLPQLDVFCYTTIFEGLASSVIDALAAKVPIVVAGVGGIQEYMNHDQNGWVFEVGNVAQAALGVQTLLTNRKLALAYVKEGAATAQQFDKTHMVAGTIAIYEETRSKL